MAHKISRGAALTKDFPPCGHWTKRATGHNVNQSID
ncbi:hypothetical protein EcWSU1_01340 [Enterobacter ludwigii]|uniref:Uncharacterized protein n=1 Tax=Enterobacter ludwigii TaxID=299767 RepID=G8LFX0_9ENTR|nr:hypothetical protein EcWSU1_01340 [Enterobacter ludwigii]